MATPNFITKISNKIEQLTSKGRTNKRARIAQAVVSRVRQDAKTRKEAIAEAEMPYFPFRVKMQTMFLNTAENGHITACVNRRKGLTLLRKWEFTNASGSVDQKVTEMFCDIIGGKTMKKAWFKNFLSFALDAEYYGYSLIFLGDIENNSFVGTEVVRRTHISPDRFNVTAYENMTEGVKFLEDESIKDNYVYVSTPNKLGTSPCGYGMYCELSMYEIFLRNLLGFNGDYLEVNIAPFRQIKSIVTEESERAELENIAREMGTQGFAITEPDVDIIFHPSGGSGSGWQAFGDTEQRIEDKCSQIILGHSDAIKSIPGKLGNDNSDSPAQKALEDKQTEDGENMMALVNNVLIPKMRAHGFLIPEGTIASLINDNEDDDNANNVADLAIKIKNAGLQMDPAYFTEKTKIPVTTTEVPTIPSKPISKNISNRLKEMYG